MTDTTPNNPTATNQPALATVKQLASVMGVNEATIKLSWMKMTPPCPSVKQGRRRLFDVDAVMAWRQANGVNGQPGRPAKTPEQKLKLELELLQQKVQKFKIENGIRQGKLIDAAKEQARDLAKINYLKTTLQQAASKWAADLDGMTLRERQAHLQTEIDHMLGEFAR